MIFYFRFKMSFRIGSGGKSGNATFQKGKTGISLGGFSFKQLEEEEEEEEDLSVFTGKYEKVLEETQKSNKWVREKTNSTSSNSSACSASSDLKTIDPMPLDGQPSNKDVTGHKTIKKVSSDPTEVTSSPLRKQAIAKLESSKELFSGLKGKITDKISKTIEEFSSDSSSTPSPENEEKAKPMPIQLEKSNSQGPIIAESAGIVGSTTVSDHPLSSLEKEKEEVQSSEDIFKDPDEDSLSLASAESCDSGGQALVFQDIYTNEPFEDFTGTQGFSTSTKLGGKSKIKRLIHKTTKKTLAVASMSGLISAPEKTKNVSSNPDITEAVDKNICDSKVHSPKSNADFSNHNKSKSSSLMTQLSRTNYTEPSLQKYIAAGILVFAYMIFPMPSYLSGFVMGCLLTSCGGFLYFWLTKPVKIPEPLFLPPIEDLPPPPVPEMKQSILSEETFYKVSKAPENKYICLSFSGYEFVFMKWIFSIKLV